MFKAELKNYRQSPRKVRLVADLVRGKKVNRALVELDFLNKKASLVVKKLIESAVANAKHNFNTEKDNLIVKELRVDEGIVLKRFNPGSRGRAFPFKRRSSHILVVLSEDGKKIEKVTEKTLEKAKKVKKTDMEGVKKTVKKVVKAKKAEKEVKVKKVIKKTK